MFDLIRKNLPPHPQFFFQNKFLSKATRSYQTSCFDGLAFPNGGCPARASPTAQPEPSSPCRVIHIGRRAEIPQGVTHHRSHPITRYLQREPSHPVPALQHHLRAPKLWHSFHIFPQLNLSLCFTLPCKPALAIETSTAGKQHPTAMLCNLPEYWHNRNLHRMC